MFTRYISFPIFLVSLAIGLFFVYLSTPPPTLIYVYPTPENNKQLQYQDETGGCFRFDAKQVECGENALPIPIQQIMG